MEKPTPQNTPKADVPPTPQSPGWRTCLMCLGAGQSREASLFWTNSAGERNCGRHKHLSRSWTPFEPLDSSVMSSRADKA